mmetsp:Transcript_94315/g.184946  ORF Transcript_94315/g.184946 Transcript_94315/m.184946 type:complete len:344 (+) Transcript_94315:26-1057(+)
MNINGFVEFAINACEANWFDIKQYVDCMVSPENTVSQCYYQSDALAVGYIICGVLIAYSFIWSIVGNNCSKVDQIWSIAPVLYCWHFFIHYAGNHGAAPVHWRLLCVCLLSTLWGIRLTFNFWRKGGYGTFIEHEEDYRWPILRAKMHPVVFLLFNFSFIAIYQNLLLFWIAVPSFEVMKTSVDMSAYDCLVACAFAALLVMETVADEQHWVFQSTKHSLSTAQRLSHSDHQIREGFFQSGLFQYSRHPNYFAEQSMWVCVYLFTLSSVFNESNPTSPVCTTPSVSHYVNWTCLGCIQLILLFQGSMAFGESITLSKYPQYAHYQKTTSMCVPLPSFRAKDAK